MWQSAIVIIAVSSSAWAQTPSPTPTPSLSAAAQQASIAAAEAEATLDIEWEKIEDATSYEIKLTPATGGEVLKFTRSDTKLTQKLPQGTYKFQIRSRDKSSGYFGPWSEETEVEVTPRAVQLISPKEGEEIAEPKQKRAQVEFQWTPIVGAKEYTLRIWFDEEKNAREFKSRVAKKVLTLPTAKTYAWQVTFLTDRSIGYLAAPQIGNFKVLGKQLMKPILTEKVFPVTTAPNTAVTNQLVKWRGSTGAKSFKVKLSKRALDEESWTLVTEVPKQEASQLQFEKLKPGAYKIEVVSQSPNRVSSEPAVYEFTVKPSEEELAEAMKRAL